MSNSTVTQATRFQSVIAAEPLGQPNNQPTVATPVGTILPIQQAHIIPTPNQSGAEPFLARPIAPQVQRPIPAARSVLPPSGIANVVIAQPVTQTMNQTMNQSPLTHILTYQPVNQSMNQTHIQPSQAVVPVGSPSSSAPSSQSAQALTQTNNQTIVQPSLDPQQQQQMQFQQAMNHQTMNQSILSSPTARFTYLTPASPGVGGQQFATSTPAGGPQMNQPMSQSNAPFTLPPNFASPQLFTSVSSADINSLYQSTSGFVMPNQFMKGPMVAHNLQRPPSRDSMNVRKNACAVCHQAKTSCNGQRPCDRCIRLDRQQLCVDRPRKQPRRVEKPIKKSEDDPQSPVSVKSKRVKTEHPEYPAAVESRRPADLLQPILPRSHVPPKSDSSGASSESKEPEPIHEEVDSDYAVNNAHAADVARRQCSAAYSKCHSQQQTRAQILEALAKGDLSPGQASFYVHYFATILTEEDFATLMAVPQAASAEGNIDAARAWLADVMPGRNLPKFTFSFADSAADAVQDESSLGVDFATMQITCQLDNSGPGISSSSPTSVTPVPASPQSNLISSSSSAFSSWAAQQAAAAAVVAAEHQKHLDSLVVTNAHLTVRVNREFERLFGWSQRQLRDMFAREAGLMLYRMVAPSSQLLLTKLLCDGMLGGQSEWKRVIRIMTHFGSTLDAMFIGRWLLDENGVFKTCSYSFTALPDEIQPQQK